MPVLTQIEAERAAERLAVEFRNLNEMALRCPQAEIARLLRESDDPAADIERLLRRANESEPRLRMPAVAKFIPRSAPPAPNEPEKAEEPAPKPRRPRKKRAPRKTSDQGESTKK